MEGGRLRLFDPAKDTYLLTHEEDFKARLQAEAERDQEISKRQAAEALVAEMKRKRQLD